MSTVVMAVLGVLVLVALARKTTGPSVRAEVALAQQSKDLAPVIEMLTRMKLEAQPNAFNLAIRQLWDAYDREMAAVLVKEFAERHRNERIAQYWLDQIQKVEPEVARKMFKTSFIRDYYRPEVAASCGPVG